MSGKVPSLALMLGRVSDIRRGGAAALDLCHVAAGHVDAYWELDNAPWDYAAGSVIAREAGAEVLFPQAAHGRGPAVVVSSSPLMPSFLSLLMRRQGRWSSYLQASARGDGHLFVCHTRECARRVVKLGLRSPVTGVRQPTRPRTRARRSLCSVVPSTEGRAGIAWLVAEPTVDSAIVVQPRFRQPIQE